MTTLLPILFIIVGVLAIGEPVVAGLAMALLVGWALILGAVAHVIGAFTAGGFGRGVWQLLIAIGYFAGGLYFVTHPLLGLGTLTIFLAIVLCIEAIAELVLFTATRTLPGAGWRLFNALVTALLAIMIFVQWPSSSVWVIGTIVGINLVLTGVTRLMVNSALRQLTRGA
jgi:uncharacterized membrane protein HdeD (DUF308 family)